MDINLLANMSEAEQRSLYEQIDTYRIIADVMQLNGAGVLSGDIMSAMVRLGLRVVSVNDGDIEDNAQARLDALTDEEFCNCEPNARWMRLKDEDGPGNGWWHRDDGHHFTRKCPEGKTRPRKR
jgi:hypothetical protein